MNDIIQLVQKARLICCLFSKFSSESFRFTTFIYSRRIASRTDRIFLEERKMSKAQNRVPEFFNLVYGINRQAVSRLKEFLYRCAAYNKDAIVFVSGSGGDEYCVNDIMATMKALNVHVTTIGFGAVQNVVAAVFCLGDNRILMEGAFFELTDLMFGANDAYTEKTLLSKETFKEKVSDSRKKKWLIKKSEWKKYGIITHSHSQIVRQMMKIFKSNEYEESMFFFDQGFDAPTTLRAIKYLYHCAANNQVAVIEICSNGGVGANLRAIVDTLRLTKVKLITIGGGNVASCAAILFLMGEIRCLKSGTKFLLHEGSTTIEEKTIYLQEDMEEAYRAMKADNIEVMNIWLSKTAVTKEEYKSKVEDGKDWIVPEEEWKKWGIVTTEYDEVNPLILERMKTE